MKQLVLILFSVVSLTAMADDYNYLGIVQSNDQIIDFEIKSLRKITFVAGEMVLATDDGERTLPVETLDRMFFSSKPSAMEGVRDNATKSVSAIYTVDGRRVPTVPTEGLRGGIYIIKYNDGTTVKAAY